MGVLPDGVNVVSADAKTGIIGKGVKVPVSQVPGACVAPSAPTEASVLVMNPDGTIVAQKMTSSTATGTYSISRSIIASS